MKILSIITLFFFVFGQVKSQQIEIGKPAEEILVLIQWSVKNSANTNSYWDVKYFDGKISDVILCYHKQYLIDFKLVTSYCKHYIMSNGKFSYLLTQYEDISLSKLHSCVENILGKKKTGSYYYDDDYEHYSQVYLSDNGLATLEYRKTDMNKLPITIINSIQAKKKEKKIKEQIEIQKEQQKQIEIQKEQQKQIEIQKQEEEKRNEITSKVYDLKEYDSSLYNIALRKIKGEILHFFKSSNNRNSIHIPTFEELKNRNNKQYRFTNTYNAEYRIEESSHNVRRTKKITLVSGSDNSCLLFNSISVNLPALTIQGYSVMTNATFPNISVDFFKGITEVKIKNDIITFLEYIPDNDIQNKLLTKLKGFPKGKYLVNYEFGEIMGEEFNNVEVEKSEPKPPPSFRPIW